MPLTKIFQYAQPQDYEERQPLLERQKALVEGFADTLRNDETHVMLALNEYGAIGNLTESLQNAEDCRRLYDQLVAAGYEESAQLGEYFNENDSDQIAIYLVGQAMKDLREGRPPAPIFVVRSSLALKGVEPSQWQSAINREILLL